MADSQRLDVPRGRARSLGSFLRLNPDAVGQFAEGIARFLGTGRFLAVQTILVTVWIALNVFAVRLRWDPYPFILLNLAFSTQAAYAAPLILLAQNRQADRDAQRRELATRDFIRDQLNRLTDDDHDAEKREKKAKKKRDPVT